MGPDCAGEVGGCADLLVDGGNSGDDRGVARLEQGIAGCHEERKVRVNDSGGLVGSRNVFRFIVIEASLCW